MASLADVVPLGIMSRVLQLLNTAPITTQRLLW